MKQQFLARERPRRAAWSRALLVLAAAFLVVSPIRSAGADAPTLVVETSIVSGTPPTESTSATIRVGDIFSLILKYTCASSSPCEQTVVTDSLPPELEVIDVITPSQVASRSNIGADYVPASEPPNRRHYTPGMYTFTMVDPLPGGSTGQIQIKVRFPTPWTANMATATNTISMSAANATTATSNSSVATADAGQSHTAQTYLQYGGAVDDVASLSARYCFTPNSPYGVGDLGITSATLTDTLPAGASFVSADQGGIESSPGVVTWSLGDVYSQSGCYGRSVVVRFNSSDASNVVGATKTNTVDFAGTRFGEPSSGLIAQATADLTLYVGSANGWLSKSTNTPRSGPGPVSQEAMPGEQVAWNAQFYNNGSLTLDDVVVHDDIPAPTRIDYLLATNYGADPMGVWVSSVQFPTARLAISVNPNTGDGIHVYQAWPSGVSALTAGDEVTSVELRANGLAPQRGVYLYLHGTVSELDRSNVTVAVGDLVTNTVTSSAIHGAATLSYSASASFIIRLTPAPPQPSYLYSFLSINNSLITPAQHRQQIFTLQMYATANTLDPTARALLPPDTALSSYRVQSGPVPTITATSNWQGTGRTLLAVSWPPGTVVGPNAQLQVVFTTTLGPSLWGTGISAALVAWADSTATPYQCAYSRVDSFDGDEDGDSTEYLCGNDNSFEIQAVAAANVTTSMRGSLDPSFVPGPARALALAGDGVTERVVVTNEGSAPLDQITIVNVVPTATDTNVSNSTSRNSATPGLVFDGSVTVPVGATPWYTETPNPCRPEVGYSPSGCNTATWTSTLGTASNVTAIKVSFGTTVVDPGASVVIDIAYRVPAGAIAGSTVVDSAAFSSRRTDLGSSILPSESVTSGVRIPTDNFTLSGAITSDVDAVPEGVRLYLFAPGQDGNFNTSDDVLWTTTETTGGSYQFVGLGARTYRVVVDPLWRGDSKIATADADGSTPADGVADVVLAGSLTGLDFSFGSISIGDRVWLDLDADGHQDLGEAGINGLTVVLLDSSSNVVSTTTTGDDPSTGVTEQGWYGFSGLRQSFDYVVSVIVPTGKVVAPRDRGNDDFDNDAAADGRTGGIRFDFGEPLGRTDIDVGLVDLSTLGSVGDRVWNDVDGDGIQDAGEPGLPGQYVQLVGAGADDEFATGDDTSIGQSTDSNGEYSLTGVAPGRYQVWMNMIPYQRYLSQPHQGSDPTLDSDIDPATSRSAPFTVALGESSVDLDIGVQSGATIGGRLFDDLDGSATESAGDAGLPYKSVNVWWAGFDGTFGTSDDTRIGTSSNSSGDWTWNGRAGRYLVCVTQPMVDGSGMRSLVARGTGPSTIDSDVDPATGCSDETVVAPAAVTDVDAGYQLASGSISGHFWADTDGDGIEAAGETRRTASVVIIWAGVDGVLATDDDVYVTWINSDSSGDWSLPHALDGVYRISPFSMGSTRQSPVDQGSDDTVDSDYSSANSGSAIVTVAGGAAVINVNGGLIDRVHIGDSVWDDTDGDGIFDAGEQGLSGVSISLRCAGPDSMFTTVDDSLLWTTSWNGSYNFWDVAPGTCRIETPWIPSDWGGRRFSISPLHTGVDPTVDSDINPTTRVSGSFVVGASTIDLDLDVGLIAGAGVVSGSAWNDRNANGLRDAGEASRTVGSLSVVSVGPDGVAQTSDDFSLYGAAGLDSWLIDSLPDGDYYLDAHWPSFGAVFTAQDVGTDDTIDSDVSASGVSSTFLIAGGSVVDHVDVGMTDMGEVNGTVWIDENGDGIHDVAELALPWIQLTLRGAGTDGTFNTFDDDVAFTSSGSAGDFRFQSVPDGSHRLEANVFVNSMSNYRLTTPGVGTDPLVDSDVDASSGWSQPFDVSRGGVSTRDVGYLSGNSTIAGSTFDDSNANGLRDAGEAGLGGQWVALYDVGADGIDSTGDDRFVNSTIGDGDGHYSFGSLLPGSYRVQMNSDKDLVWTLQDVGADDAVDSDVNSSGQRSGIVLGAFETVTIDGGLAPRPVVGNFVWEDLDGDGIQDSAEPGVADVSIRIAFAGGDSLLGTADDWYSTTRTKAAGEYSFDLQSGQVFRIEVGSLVAGNSRFFSLTTPGVGTDSTLDSDIDPATGVSGTRVATGTMNDLDIGLIAGTLSIGDRLWLDTDRNGVQDPAEPGIDGDVELSAPGPDNVFQTGDEVSIFTTAVAGQYRFDGVPAGRYVLTAQPRNGGFPTITTAGIDRTVDSDLITVSQLTAPFDVTGSRSDVDGGFIEFSSVSGRVWNDSNGNGVADSGEQDAAVQARLVEVGQDGLAGTDDDFVLPADEKGGDGGGDATGNFEVGVLAGRYFVRVPFPASSSKSFVVLTTADVGADDAIDSDIDPATGRSQAFDVGPGESVSGIGIGIREGSGVVAGMVWSDDDLNGVRASEPSLSGCQIRLEFFDGVEWREYSTQSTDEGGRYSFGSLIDGRYRALAENVPGVPTMRGAGSDSSLDSDMDPFSKRSDPFDVVGGSNTEIDLGLVAESSIGDYLWIDDNSNGLQDVGETGVEGIQIWATNPGTDGVGGTDDDFRSMTTSKSDGFWKIDGLPVGTYRVSVGSVSLDSNARSYRPTLPMVGSDPSLDSNIDASGAGAVLIATTGESISEFDIGLVGGDSSIGDFMWFDADRDGLQGGGELGMDKSSIELVVPGADGIWGTEDDRGVAKEADGRGSYRFDSLVPGTYRLRVPDGKYAPTLQHSGTDATVDSDASPVSGETDDIVLDVGETNLSIDIGIVKRAVSHITVWFDTNRDGLQGPIDQEPVLNDLFILIRLVGADDIFGTDDDVIDSDAKFSGEGNYVEPLSGRYRVAVPIPSQLFGFTTQDAGTDDLIDSDANAFGVVEATPRAAGSARRVAVGRTDIGAGVVDRIGALGGGGTTTIAPTTQPAPISDLPGIGDTVWLDVNGNGAQEPGEPGVAGVRMELRTQSGSVVATTTTGPQGRYRFDPGKGGVFVVRVAGGIPAGVTQTGDPDQVRDSMATVVLGSGASSVMSLDFGYQGSGTVCISIDRDGAVNVSGMNIRLSGPNGIELSGQTNANGRVCFGHLPYGDYVARGGEGGSVIVTLSPDRPSAVAVLETTVTGSRPSSLAFTGGDAALLVALGAGLLAWGLVLVRATRRRRRPVG